LLPEQIATAFPWRYRLQSLVDSGQP
jgi:hypothetical protein